MQNQHKMRITELNDNTVIHYCYSDIIFTASLHVFLKYDRIYDYYNYYININTITQKNK